MKNIFVSMTLGILATAGIFLSVGYPAETKASPVVRPGIANLPSPAPASPPKKNPSELALANLAHAQNFHQKIQAITVLTRIHKNLPNAEERGRIEKMAAPVLMELATAKSVEIRCSAIRAIPELYPVGTFDFLTGILEKEEEEEVLVLAGRMLGKVTSRDKLANLLPFFKRRDRRGLQIAVGTAWLESVTRTGMAIRMEEVKSIILPALMEIMNASDTTIAHHRMAHQLESKIRTIYGLADPQFARPVYGIAQ